MPSKVYTFSMETNKLSTVTDNIIMDASHVTIITTAEFCQS